MFENQIIYNDDNSVSVPFGRIAEWYLLQLLLLKNTRLKSQSRLKTTKLIHDKLITLNRVDGAVDFTEWLASGNQKSTNRIDDILKLTDKGQEYVNQIQAGL